MNLQFTLKNQVIKRNDRNTVVSGSKNYLYAKFVFLSEDWKAPVTVIFGRYSVLLDSENKCLVPWEVLENPGAFTVSAFCGDLQTANTVSVYVEKSGYIQGETPEEPTPDVYSQILDKVQEAIERVETVSDAVEKAEGFANDAKESALKAEQTVTQAVQNINDAKSAAVDAVNAAGLSAVNVVNAAGESASSDIDNAKNQAIEEVLASAKSNTFTTAFFDLAKTVVDRDLILSNYQYGNYTESGFKLMPGAVYGIKINADSNTEFELYLSAGSSSSDRIQKILQAGEYQSVFICPENVQTLNFKFSEEPVTLTSNIKIYRVVTPKIYRTNSILRVFNEYTGRVERVVPLNNEFNGKTFICRLKNLSSSPIPLEIYAKNDTEIGKIFFDGVLNESYDFLITFEKDTPITGLGIKNINPIPENCTYQIDIFEYNANNMPNELNNDVGIRLAWNTLFAAYPAWYDKNAPFEAWALGCMYDADRGKVCLIYNTGNSHSGENLGTYFREMDIYSGDWSSPVYIDNLYKISLSKTPSGEYITISNSREIYKSSDFGKTWNKSSIYVDGVNNGKYDQIGRLFITSTGRALAHIAYEYVQSGEQYVYTKTAKIMYSDDLINWTLAETTFPEACAEAQFLELDGTIFTVCRTWEPTRLQKKPFILSKSVDNGQTWESATFDYLESVDDPPCIFTHEGKVFILSISRLQRDDNRIYAYAYSCPVSDFLSGNYSAGVTKTIGTIINAEGLDFWDAGYPTVLVDESSVAHLLFYARNSKMDNSSKSIFYGRTLLI